MLISKRSRRQSELFSSRFRDEGVDFPLRRYLRAREDFASGLVHLVLLVALGVTVAVFGRTLDHLFDTHGAHLNPWWRRGVLVLWGLFGLSVLRRLYYKVGALREIRREMAALKASFREPGE